VKKIRYLEAAWFELKTATSGYVEISDRLRAEFETEYRDAILHILSFPEMAPEFEGPVRRKVLRKFPFSILYRVVAEDIEIVALMHHRQRPGYWIRRTRRGG
jgi:plasmid stabilization system protein ParE